MKYMKTIIKKILSGKQIVKQPKLDSYWIQNIKVNRVEERLDVFKPYLENKKVLHIGCSDYPIFKPETNLHLAIKNMTSELHGMDVDKQGIEELRKHYDSIYYTNLLDSKDNVYDTILVPETIEHVENIGFFLKEINSLKADNYIITAPNCFNDFFPNQFDSSTNIFTEAIHPDHNCWFSPYTLKNVIQKYTNLKVREIYLCNKDLMIVCICSR